MNELRVPGWTLLGFAILTLFAGCGLNFGFPPRRVFPNPPSRSSLEDVPISNLARGAVPRCQVPIGGLVRVDFAAPAPWGVKMDGGDVLGVIPDEKSIAQDLVARVESALAGCPRAPAGSSHRVVIEIVEVDEYDDYNAGRVVLRLERFDQAFTFFESWRAEGRI